MVLDLAIVQRKRGHFFVFLLTAAKDKIEHRGKYDEEENERYNRVYRHVVDVV